MREGGRLSSHPCILSLFFLIAVIDIVRPFLSCAHCQGTGAPSNLSRRSSIVSFDIVEIVSNPHEIWGEGVLLFVVFHSLSFAFSFLACWRRCGALNLEGEWYLIHSILWIVLFYLVLLSGVGRQDSRMESFWCFSIRLCGGNLVGLVSFGLGHVILRSCSNLSFSGSRTLWVFSPFLQWRGRRCMPNESEGCFLIQCPLYPQKQLDICNPEAEGISACTAVRPRWLIMCLQRCCLGCCYFES